MNSILIVDDEKDNLEALQRLLRKDYDLTLETSPFAALKHVQQKEFSVIISDQRMPEMTGVELLEKAKKIAPSTTRILLTGYTDMAAVVDAINRGQVYHYIAKPWDPEDLRLTLRQSCEAFDLKKEIELKNKALGKSNDELKKALASLRLLDQAKGRFMSLISHELNTPLTVLTSFTELLKENKTQFSQDIQTAVESLSSATDRFSEIINEVLLYVRLESENTLNLQPFDLEKATKEIASQFAKEVKKKKIKVGLKALKPGSIDCDPEKMKVALSKLLKHTIAYAPKESEIKIVIDEEENDITYTVTRSGSPISKEAFESFIAAGEELNHHRDMGMALAICKIIIDGHGGKISLEKSDDKHTVIALSFSQSP